MSRLPLVAFAALTVATGGAFFVTQHLKVSTPLIAGMPKPNPATISPAGDGCGGTHRTAKFSFYLLHRADDVSVYVVDAGGTIVRTLASGRHMRRGVRTPDGSFPWNGRTDNGRVAPDGTYFFRIALLGQGRTIELPTPVLVKSTPPHPVVSDATPPLLPNAGGRVTIHLRGNGRRRGLVRLYRTDLPGGPRLVKSFRTPGKGQAAVWDGSIARRPAPAGIYLVGLDVTDQACNTGHFPDSLPPRPGTTQRAGVTVRYLAAEPPLDPVAAGRQATVLVDSRRQPYRWTLQRAGTRRVLTGGSGTDVVLHVPVPRGGSGLYVVAVRSGAHRTAVPLLASSGAPAGSGPRILVVLPALTWQGLSSVDDDGDGLPNTLDAGEPVKLARVLAGGLPAGLADEQALIGYLDRAHLGYELTTDLALIDGGGPQLTGHAGVVLAGSERWLTAALRTSLRAYVQGGGHLLSLGLDSLRRQVTLSGGQASSPTASAPSDIFGVRSAALVHTHDLITVSRDGLGLFSGTSGVLSGFDALQPLTPDPGITFVSAAGFGSQTAVLVGLRFGRGIVVELGLAGFGQRLARNVGAQELIGRLWQLLGR